MKCPDLKHISDYKCLDCVYLRDSKRPEISYSLPEKCIQENLPDKELSPFCQNGFINDKFEIWQKLPFTEKLELIICALILPIRFIIALLFIILLNIFAVLGTIGLDTLYPANPDITGIRKFFMVICMLCYRGFLFTLGAWYLEEKGEKADKFTPHIKVVAPHSTFFDAMVNTVDIFNFTSPVSSAEAGPLMKSMRLILSLFIDRDTYISRKETFKEMICRLKVESFPPILIFPEACTHTAKQLLAFKPGAFAAKVPVQPVTFTCNENSFQFNRWTFIAHGHPLLAILLKVAYKYITNYRLKSAL